MGSWTINSLGAKMIGLVAEHGYGHFVTGVLHVKVCFERGGGREGGREIHKNEK